MDEYALTFFCTAQLSSGSDEKAIEKKRFALQEFLQLSKANAAPIWTQVGCCITCSFLLSSLKTNFKIYF